MNKVSVIVPCYNSEKYIGKCLDSLVNQTLKELDIIVINDGSTDNSLNIITEYANKFPNVKVYTKQNEGIASARNYALDKVETPYFGFLDSDDHAEKTMFEKMLQKIETTKAQMVVTNFNWVENGNNRLEKEGPYEPKQEMMINLFAVLWNKLYDTAFVRSTNIRFPDGNRYEDAYFLYCLCAHVDKISFIDEAFVYYVQHGKSITHTNNHEVKNMITVFNGIVDHYQQINEYEQYHDELEYLHIKFFLGNSFLRSAKIADKEDRKNTIMLGWNLLNDKFPNWAKNRYLHSLPGLKNKYFRVVRRWNIMIFAWIFRNISKDKN
ncbi:MAG: glycosyltransferase [Erysipelotrichaceae bacterium]|nr:glycosyltransferase [Erysipelotrichaceae bacterium]MDY5252418.1 glycosyltransferase [Erysipelotrichaceae bacterium]